MPSRVVREGLNESERINNLSPKAQAVLDRRNAVVSASMLVLDINGQYELGDISAVLDADGYTKDIADEAVELAGDVIDTTSTILPMLGVDVIRAELWKISQEKISANELHRKASTAVVEWLHGRGRFYFFVGRRDFASVMFFDACRKLLLPIQSDAFIAWLADALAMNRAERSFAFVASACETEGLSDRSTGIEPATYWASSNSCFYLSCGPGHMVRMSANSVEMVDNGTDGILFPYGATLSPWKLTDPVDPFEACSLFREMSTAAKHGIELFKLWVCSLPSDQLTKPPLVSSGTVGSGKTRLARGIFELYGLPPRIAAVLKNGDGDFWAAMDAGGLACFDNADTRIDWLPDALAAAATAGTLEKRRLYTDSERVSLKARSWVCITSASPTFASDAGLADRLIVIRLNRRTGETAEASLSSEIVRNRDAGLSWICQMLARALADTDPVPDGINARHPDFAALAVRIGRAMGRGSEAIEALKAAEIDKGIFNLENDWIGAAILEVVQAESFTGTAGELLEELKKVDPSLDSKLSAKRLSKRISKLWPHLQQVLHATDEHDGHTKQRFFTLQPPEVAGIAGIGEAFSVKSYVKRNIDTLPEMPSEYPQYPHGAENTKELELFSENDFLEYIDDEEVQE